MEALCSLLISLALLTHSHREGQTRLDKLRELRLIERDMGRAFEVNESTSDYGRELVVGVGRLHVDFGVTVGDVGALGQGVDVVGRAEDSLEDGEQVGGVVCVFVAWVSTAHGPCASALRCP